MSKEKGAKLESVVTYELKSKLSPSSSPLPTNQEESRCERQTDPYEPTVIDDPKAPKTIRYKD